MRTNISLDNNQKGAISQELHLLKNKYQLSGSTQAVKKVANEVGLSTDTIYDLLRLGRKTIRLHTGNLLVIACPDLERGLFGIKVKDKQEAAPDYIGAVEARIVALETEINNLQTILYTKKDVLDELHNIVYSAELKATHPTPTDD